MSLSRIIIRNFKSIKYCDISFAGLNVLIGENAMGKTNLLEAISYFFSNLTGDCVRQNVFDENNPFSNEVRITLVYDLTELVRIKKCALTY